MGGLTIKHEPTKELRQVVERAARCGLRKKDVQEMLGIQQHCFDRYYRTEWDRGKLTAHMKVGQKLFDTAMRGNVPAMIFYLKCQAKWREVDVRVNLNANQGLDYSIEELVERLVSKTQFHSIEETQRLAEAVVNMGGDGGAADGGTQH